MFTLLFAVVIVLFILAVARQTIIPSVLSCVTWLILAFASYVAADPEDPLTSGVSLLSLLMFFVMLAYTIYMAAKYLEANAEEKQRRIAEEVF
jgi:4-hydroxybenzoate polyprenyltransferase